MILNEDIFDKKENLKEDFSESMPRWVRAGLRAEIGRVGTAYSSRSKYKDYKGSTLKKYPEVADYPAKSYTGRGDNEYADNIFSKLRERGIDLTKAKFITGPVPTKGSDPRLKEPNIPFLSLEYNGSKQLYVKGINDTMDSIVPKPDGNYARLRYIPMPEILKYTTDFAYINGDDPENKADDRATRRSLEKRDLPKNYYRNTQAKKGERTGDWYNKSYYDASGYIVDPTRYLGRLRDFMKKNASKHVKKAYDRILAIQESLSNAIRDIDDPLDINTVQRISDIVRRYNYDSMISYYKNMINNLKAADAANAAGEDYARDNYLSNIFDRGGDLDYFNRNAEAVEKDLSKYVKTVVDWDNPE